MKTHDSKRWNHASRTWNRGQQELSDALYRQQRELDALRLRNQQLLAEAEGGASTTSLTSDERPPHY